MTCPICARPAQASVRPFCSRRCADIDLSRWLKGGYAIPGEPGGGDHDEPPGEPPRRSNRPENNHLRTPDKGMDRP